MSQSQNEQHYELERFARQWHQWYVEERLPLRCCKGKFDQLFKILQLHEGGRGYHATEEQWRECRRNWAARWQLRRSNPTLPAELALKELWYKNNSILETIRDTHALIQEHTVISPRCAALEAEEQLVAGLSMEGVVEDCRRRSFTTSDWTFTRQDTQPGIDQAQELNRAFTESSENPCSPNHQVDTASTPIEVDSRYQQPGISTLESWYGDKSDLTIIPQTISPREYFSSQDLGSAATGGRPSAHSAFSVDDVGNMLDVIRSRPWRRTEGGYGGSSNTNSVYRAPRMRRRSHRHGDNVLRELNVPRTGEALLRPTTSVFQFQEGTEPTEPLMVPTDPSSTTPSLPLWPRLPLQNSHAISLFDPNDLSSNFRGLSQEWMFRPDNLDVQYFYHGQHVDGPDQYLSQGFIFQ